MSINSALLAGASGLISNSNALASISDNIANVNTVGYKRAQTVFNPLYTSSGETTRYSAGGVQSLSRLEIGRSGLLTPRHLDDRSGDLRRRLLRRPLPGRGQHLRRPGPLHPLRPVPGRQRRLPAQ